MTRRSRTFLHALLFLQPESDPHGRALSRPPRRRRSQALLRSRFRTFLFLVLALLACAIGHPAAAAPAVLGVLIGLVSGAVARRQGQRLALSFAVLDWLLLGCVLALAGGVHSWLLGAVPILTAGQLGVSPHHDWPYLLAPASLLAIVLAIADPSLGGNKMVSVAVFLLLVTGGVAAACRIDPSRVRRARPARSDAVTGFHTAQRLREIAAPRLQVARAEQQPLSLVYLQLQHFEGSRGFLGARGGEALIKGVAQRLRSQLGPDDLAFRLAPDAFALVLPGRSLSEARALAAAAAREVSGGLIAGRRQTLATGAAAFPAAGSVEELLLAARNAARRATLDEQSSPQVAKLAAAQ